MNRRSLLATIMLATLTTACTYVPAGHVGVLINLYGSNKGVQGQGTEVGPGRYWLGFNEQIFTFPTFTQTYTWAGPASLSFQSVEGLVVTSGVGITYTVVPDKVPLLFQKYREGMDEITNTYLHNMIRDALVEEASRIPVETIYGKGKADFVASVQADVQKQVSDIGINVDKVYLVGQMGLPDQVEAAIHAKIAATQKAEQRQNEIAQAEAEKTIEITRATARAQAIKIEGDALKENPGLTNLEAVRKWDGHMPYYNGAQLPFITVSNTSAK